MRGVAEEKLQRKKVQKRLLTSLQKSTTVKTSISVFFAESLSREQQRKTENWWKILTFSPMIMVVMRVIKLHSKLNPRCFLLSQKFFNMAVRKIIFSLFCFHIVKFSIRNNYRHLISILCRIGYISRETTKKSERLFLSCEQAFRKLNRTRLFTFWLSQLQVLSKSTTGIFHISQNHKVTCSYMLQDSFRLALNKSNFFPALGNAQYKTLHIISDSFENNNFNLSQSSFVLYRTNVAIRRNKKSTSSKLSEKNTSSSTTHTLKSKKVDWTFKLRRYSENRKKKSFQIFCLLCPVKRLMEIKTW